MYCGYSFVVAAAVSSAVGQPTFVQPDFVATNIIGLIDGGVPELHATNLSSGFGEGAISVAVNDTTGIATVRSIGATGIIAPPIAIVSDPFINRAIDVGVDVDAVLAGGLHVSLQFGPDASDNQDTGMVYLTIDTAGNAVERFRVPRGGGLSYGFVFRSIATAGSIGADLYDRNAIGGNRLGTLGVSFDQVTVLANNLPPDRTDLDIQAEVRDVSGDYGGGVLLADWDCNSFGDNRTVLYSQSVGSGGQFTVVGGPFDCSERGYGDIDIRAEGSFGGVIFATNTVSNEIEQVAPDGTHTTWATGFTGIDSLSISPDGESMYVADLNGVWLIRPEGNEPGPAVLAQDPSTPGGTPMTGDPVTSARVIFTEPVSFTDADVTITDRMGTPVAFDASGSGSQFMIIGFAQPLFNDVYTITIADTLTSVATGQPLDGDNDGVAGVDAVLTLEHRCAADPANPPFVYDLSDIDAFIIAFTSACAP